MDNKAKRDDKSVEKEMFIVHIVSEMPISRTSR